MYHIDVISLGIKDALVPAVKVTESCKMLMNVRYIIAFDLRAASK